MAKAHKVDPAIVVGARFIADNVKDGDKGWIRYVGPVNQTSSSSSSSSKKHKERVWVGVEWDTPGRGKHDGQPEAGGRRYFTCAAGQGALIHPKRVIVGVSLMDAVRAKYAQEYEEDAEENHARYLVAENASKQRYSVPVEFVGQKEMHDKLSHLEQLRKVILTDGCIAHVTGKDEAPDAIAKQLCRMNELDLDNNLLTRWEQVAEVLSQATLVELRLNSNLLNPLSRAEARALFGGGESAAALGLRGVKRLFLNNVPHAWAGVVHLAHLGCLPCLEELHICKNRLQTLALPRQAEDGDGDDDARWEDWASAEALAACFPKLRLLNLSYNELTSWHDDVHRLAALPELRRLLVNHNKLARIEYVGGFEQLEWLSCNANVVDDDFGSVEQLDRFPRLTELRFQHNPVGAQLGAKLTRIIVIAKMGKLRVLNLSEVGPIERADAEKIYLQRCIDHFVNEHRKDAVGALPSSASEQDKLDAAGEMDKTMYYRYAELEQLHGTPRLSMQKVKGTVLSDRLVTLTFYQGTPEDLDGAAADAAAPSAGKKRGKPKVKKVPRQMTVQKLKQLAARLFRIRGGRRGGEVVLRYRNDAADHCQVLDDNIKQLTFYGVANEGQVFVQVE